jgi:hypothetical protein
MDWSGLNSEDEEKDPAEKKGGPLPIGWLIVAGIPDRIKEIPDNVCEFFTETFTFDLCDDLCAKDECMDCKVRIQITSANLSPDALDDADKVADLAKYAELPKTLKDAIVNAGVTAVTNEIPDIENLYIDVINFASMKYSGASIWYKVQKKVCQETSCLLTTQMDFVDTETGWMKLEGPNNDRLELTAAVKRAVKAKKELQRTECSRCF